MKLRRYENRTAIWSAKLQPFRAFESSSTASTCSGNVTTDANGEATVTLPDDFEALHRDFRYQLTVIGQFAQAIVLSEIKGGPFIIKTDKPNVRVSWQVAAIRRDALPTRIVSGR